MARARYSKANANAHFKEYNNFQDGQWLYVKNTTFTDMDHGSLYVKIRTAMDDPNSGIDMAMAQQALSEINAGVSKYAKQAPLVLAAAATLKESLGKQ